MHIYTFIVTEHVARMFYMDLNEHDELSIITVRHTLM
jgi:hypothetical protein